MEDNLESEIINDNLLDSEDIRDVNASDVIVYARDWTIETIYNQINIGNIDLNPKFQRRNAWNDVKRSQLVESIIIGYPIPEIVLAEDPSKKRSFIVIDGKQRLLTIAGFVDNEKYKYWDTPRLKKLNVLADLNKKTYLDLDEKSRREFDNSSLRCTVITNYSDIQVLYDIENLLRLFAFVLYSNEYRGNLRKFLDDKMQYITSNWKDMRTSIEDLYNQINKTIDLLKEVLGDYKFIGRKLEEEDSFSSRFNKVLFEVEIFYFIHLDNSILEKKAEFKRRLHQLCASDADFKDSIESSTKNLENYKIRYSKFQDIINNSFNMNLSINPFL